MSEPAQPRTVLPCPVCKEAMVLPRLFPQCGHTICTACHMQLDRRCRTSHLGFGVDVKCPLCRKHTTVPAALRPVNSALHGLLETLVGKPYQKACALARSQFADEIKSDEEPPDYAGVDLASVCTLRRSAIARAAYERVMSMIGYAAEQGMPVVVVTDEALVADCAKVLDLLKTRLFEENNLAKIRYCSISKEITIDILDVTLQNYYCRE